MRVLEGRVGRLSWRALQPFGAEVEGDLSQPLTPEEAACLRKVFYDHELIIARNQKLTLAQQQALAGCIGPVLADGRGMEYVSPDDGILNDAALTFHSDLAFAPEPFQALSLHAVDVAENRTSTRFANAHRAYERMRAGLKGRIAGMKAISMSVDLGPVRSTPHEVPANSIHHRPAAIEPLQLPQCHCELHPTPVKLTISLVRLFPHQNDLTTVHPRRRAMSIADELLRPSQAPIKPTYRCA